MAEALVVNEIYLSLQGESTFAGLPCIFVRLTACNLRCSYCDTAYAFVEGRRMSFHEIHERITQLAQPYARHTTPTSPRPAMPPQRLPLIELTGGEPLLQPDSVLLMQNLCDQNFTVLLETSGAHDISVVDDRVHRIMDLKCPSSGESGRNRWENLRHLTLRDELKFVIGTHQDYAWTKKIIQEHQLHTICPILVSSVAPLNPDQKHPSLKPIPPDHTPLSRLELAQLVIADALPVRFQLQMHKFIWPPSARAV